MVIGVVVNLLSGFVVEQKWAWLPSAVFVAALLVAVLSTGLLRRERYDTTRARAMALLTLTGYLAVTGWGTVTGWPLAVMILSLAYLWEVGVMFMWSTLRSRADIGHVALGTACLLWVRRSCCCDGVPYLFAVDGFWQRLVGWPRCLSCRWCPSALRKPASTGVPDLHPPAGGSTRLEAMKPA